MASENIEFKVKIDGVEEEIKSLKDLKQAIKAATDEQLRAAEKFGIGSKEYQKASQRVSELKDKVEDLRDSTKSLQGSGIERASAGFSQFGEGLKNLDFDKVKVGFSAMKTAIAAVGIGLLVQLVTYLYENFERLSKGSGGLAVALRAVGDVITGVLEVGEKMLNWVTDAIGLTSEAARVAEKELEKVNKLISEQGKKISESLKGENLEYDKQIALLKAAGKATEDVEKQKLKNIIATNEYLKDEYKRKQKLEEEDKKLLIESAKAAYDAKLQLQIMEVTANKAALDKQKENYKKYLEAEKKHQEELKKLREQLIDNDKSVIQNTQFALQRKAELEAEYAAQQKAIDDARDAEQMAKDNKEFEEWEKREQRKKDLKKFYENDSAKYSLEITKMTLDSMQNLSDVYFLYKSKGLQKDSKQAEDAARKQFQINKAIAITSATISGIQGVVNALSAQVAFPEPFATAYRVANAVSVGIAAASNVAKISATQFNSGASSSGGGGSAPSVPIPAPPTAPQPQEGRRSTTFDESGATSGTETFRTMQPTITVKAQVVESDMTDAQKRINRFDRQTTF